MSSYLDRIRAYHDQTIAAGVKAGHDAKVVRLSLDLEAKQSIYHTHVKLARQARAAGRKEEAREQERKRALSFRAFINTARTAEHGGVALALLREREAGR